MCLRLHYSNVVLKKFLGSLPPSPIAAHFKLLDHKVLVTWARIKNMFACPNAADPKKRARPKFCFCQKNSIFFFFTSGLSEIFRFPTVNLFLKFYIIQMFE